MENHFNKSVEILKEHGLIFHSSIEQKRVNGIPGIYATKDISCNTIIAEIGNNVCFTDNDRYSSIFSNKDINAKYSIDVQCIAYLLYETLNNKSIYTDYFKLLPTLGDLKLGFINLNSDIYKELGQVSKDISNFIQLLCNTNSIRYSNLENFLRDYNLKLNVCELEWGVFYCTNYAWRDSIQPMMDLFNHSNSAEINVPIRGKMGQVIINKEIKAGEQIYISYGVKDIVKLALTYGFFDHTDDIYFIELSNIIFTARNSLDFFKVGLLVDNVSGKIINHSDKEIIVEVDKLLISSDYFSKNSHKQSKKVNNKLITFINILSITNLGDVVNLQTNIIHSDNFNKKLMEVLQLSNGNFHSDILKPTYEYDKEYQHVIEAIRKKQDIINKLIEDCKNLL